jgi:Alpha/beta hydrolase family
MTFPGLGNDSLIWANVQPELSKTTRVCSYDRAGFGWSEPRPDPRDADRIVQELHGLLTEAGITGPIVLMGHSISGLCLRFPLSAESFRPDIRRWFYASTRRSFSRGGYASRKKRITSIPDS